VDKVFNVGKQIKMHRLLKGLTRSQLAERVGFSRSFGTSTIAAIEEELTEGIKIGRRKGVKRKGVKSLLLT